MSKIMAHRGARNLWAENSAYGFRETAKHGFDCVEFDLHLTDAGEIVVMHDASLDRTTNQTGPVRALTAESRKNLRLKAADGQLIDEGVPSFREVLEILAPTRTELFVELKADENGVPYAGLVAKTTEMLREFGLVDRSVVHSFNIDVVREIRDVAPEFRRLISVDRTWADKQGGIEVFLEEVAELVDVVGVHHKLFDEEFDLITRKRPLDKLSVWTINDEETIRKWIDRKPGYITSDDPVLLATLIEESRK